MLGCRAYTPSKSSPARLRIRKFSLSRFQTILQDIYDCTLRLFRDDEMKGLQNVAAGNHCIVVAQAVIGI
jgi:hypothetical protein